MGGPAAAVEIRRRRCGARVRWAVRTRKCRSVRAVRKLDAALLLNKHRQDIVMTITYTLRNRRIPS